MSWQKIDGSKKQVYILKSMGLKNYAIYNYTQFINKTINIKFIKKLIIFRYSNGKQSLTKEQNTIQD